MKWVADENFRNAIVRSLLRHAPGFDVVRVQDVPEISGAGDADLVGWATRHERILLTHDLSTMIPATRVQLGPARVVLVPDSLSVAQAVEDILLLDGCSIENDWAAGVIYLPLR